MAENTLSCNVGGTRAARIVGVNCYRTLDHWIRTGLLPVEKPAHGPGSKRGFSFLDLIRARAVVRLRQQGASLQAIRKVTATLSERYAVADPLAETSRLIVAGERLYWADTEGKLLDVLRDQYAAGPLVILDVPELVRDTAARIAMVCAA